MRGSGLGNKLSMSGIKRIPKRSIIGSRVVGRCRDCVWRPGQVMAMNGREGSERFSVRLEEGGTVNFEEGQLVGPGFLTSIPVDARLANGQQVFVTHQGREVEGRVTSHQVVENSVEVDAEDVGLLYKRLEDIRLLESRKSARLINSDTDFSQLADFNIVEQRKLLNEKQSRRRLHSMSEFHDQKLRQKARERGEKRRQCSERGSLKASGNIDVPNGLLVQSRKRRSSDSRAEVDSGYGSSYGSTLLPNLSFGHEDNLKECTAAMVLMNLCTSPRDNFWLDSSPSTNSPPITPRPSPAISPSLLSFDEDEEPTKKSKPNNNIIFQCTWRGCNQLETCQEKMEFHVRQHLGRAEPVPGSERDFEEEFYYTELELEGEETMIGREEIIRNDEIMMEEVSFIEETMEPTESFVSIPFDIQSDTSSNNKNESLNILASSAPSSYGWNGDNISLSHPLGDHIGMAKPSYEAPTTYLLLNNITSTNVGNIGGKKLITIQPKPEGGETIGNNNRLGPKIPGARKNQAAIKSDKKCRKIYGIDQKDLWCTQCKWKKACGRFS